MTLHDEEDRQQWETGAWTHLPFFILRSLTDHTLGDVDKEIAQAHLDLCDTCRAEADQLFMLRRELLEAPLAPPMPAPRRPRIWELGLAGLGVVVLSSVLGSLLVGPRLEEQRLTARVQARERAALTVDATRLQEERQRLERDQAARNMKVAQLTRELARLKTPPSPSPLVKATPDPERLRLQAQVAQLEARLRERPAVDALPPPKVAVASPAPRKNSVQQVALVLPDLSVLGASEPRGTSDPPRFTLSAPAAQMVREARPRLSWSACPGAVRYRWFIARLGALDSLAEGESDGLAAAPPKDLPRGEPLAWEVHALDAGGNELGTAAQARFQLASQKQLARVERAKKPLERARALGEVGLFAEARATLSELPDSEEKRWIRKALEGK
jgi:hypothetical protein